jgi:hypothetical protein
LEIQIGQDIRKFKTKDIGNFSFKEAGYLAAAAAVAFATYKVTASMETAILPAGIVAIFGFFKPYGMTFFQFLKTVGAEKLSTQCYINETDFEYNPDEFKELYGDDVVIPADWNVIQTDKPAKINKTDKRLINSKLIR